MILITKYGWKNKFIFYYEIIYEIYKNNYYHNLKNYLENLENDVSIIYTYSSTVEENKYLEASISNKKSNIIFTMKTIKKININEINTKKQIEDEIVDFFNDLDYGKEKEDNLLIFKFIEEDLNKLFIK